MALKNLTDPDTVERALEGWLQARGTDARVSNVTIPTASGLSNETVIFDVQTGAKRERLVARIAPRGPALCPAYDLAREARIMRVLGHAVPQVPAVRYEEPDPAVLGSPFFVMPFVEGRVPADDPPFTTAGWVTGLTDTQRGAMHENALAIVAAVHATDWRAGGLQDLDRHDLEHWRGVYRWAAAGEANPTIDAALNWLEAHPPGADDLVLMWGDARVGNMVFGDDGSVRAALDWEFAGLGSRGADLGWWLVTARFHTDAIGVPRPGGFPDREVTIGRYEALSGHAVRDLAFHEAFAATRLAILMHRTGNLMVRAGLLPADSMMRLVNPATQILASMLDLPEPDGVAESFVGRRGA